MGHFLAGQTAAAKMKSAIFMKWLGAAPFPQIKLHLIWMRCKNCSSKRQPESVMKIKLQYFCILLALLAGVMIPSAAQAQNLYVANANNSTIIKITPGGDQSTFASSGLNHPYGLAFDRAGDLFVADHESGNIYEFTNGVAANQGIFASGFNYTTEPVALAFDTAGDLFVASDQSANIYEFTNGIAANQGVFCHLSSAGIQGLAFDSSGNLFASQPGNNTIAKITPGGVQSNFASNLNFPVGLAFDSSGNLFAANGGSGKIYEYTNGVAANQGTFATPTSSIQGLTFDSAGDLFVTDETGGKIYEFTNGVAANQGIFASGLDSPESLAFAPNSITTLTNIVVSPASPVIGTGSNQQFTATGYYSDGSSQVLTNGGSGGSGVWTAVAGMPAAKAEASCAAVNGQMYVVSGLNGDYTVFAYNSVSNVWTNSAPLPIECSFPGAAGIGNKLYVMGGGLYSNNSYVTNALYIYNALTNGWTQGSSMSNALSAMGVGVINGKIYLAGGQVNNASQTALQIYDPSNNTWTKGHAMPVPCAYSGAAVINGKLYVVGGSTGGTIYSSLLVYDPTTDSWTTNAPMLTPRAGLGAVAVNGLLYAIDGYSASLQPTNLVEVYNPVTDHWSTGVPTLIAHVYFQPVLINGTIYIAGNGPGNTAITNAESYTPQSSLSWSSSSQTVATIDTNGIATGLTTGTSTIAATYDSISGTTVLTVVAQPSISIQPTNNTVSPNGSVTLNVSAIGGDLSYQWQFNGTNIAGANGASFTITNVSGANVGVYTVVVSNAAGSTTSQTAIVGNIAIQMFAGVVVNGPVGTNYVIQSTSNLNNGWTTRTNLALPSQPYIYIDYSSPTNPQQFYRAGPQ
jgi:sugar lactone lactonase YvrE